MTTNEKLQAVYNQMHNQGPSAWFSDGSEERQAILRAGSPWTGLRVLEVGCGEGELVGMIAKQGCTNVTGIDYSQTATDNARGNLYAWGCLPENAPASIMCRDYRTLTGKWDRVVMQGVLEHLDRPWTELEWMIDNLLTPAGDIITSSPCFCNPRGVVWMTLATLFDAPMSLTDLHFLHPWEFLQWAREHDFNVNMQTCDKSWGGSEDMVADFRQRLPKVFPEMKADKIEDFLEWLGKAGSYPATTFGATAVYHLSRK